MNDRNARPATSAWSGARLARLGPAAICLALVISSCAADDDGSASDGDESTATDGSVPDELATATAYFDATADMDWPAARNLIDPSVVDVERVTLPFGPETLDEGYALYEAIGWSWTFDECRTDDASSVVCTAAASSLWSDALGIDSVPGEFRVRVGDQGITSIQPISFDIRPIGQAFIAWVEDNHPEDAEIMFADVPLTEEILELHEVNTQRFVEANRDG